MFEDCLVLLLEEPPLTRIYRNVAMREPHVSPWTIHPRHSPGKLLLQNFSRIFHKRPWWVRAVMVVICKIMLIRFIIWPPIHNLFFCARHCGCGSACCRFSFYLIHAKKKETQNRLFCSFGVTELLLAEHQTTTICGWEVIKNVVENGVRKRSNLIKRWVGNKREFVSTCLTRDLKIHSG